MTLALRDAGLAGPSLRAAGRTAASYSFSGTSNCCASPSPVTSTN